MGLKRKAETFLDSYIGELLKLAMLTTNKALARYLKDKAYKLYMLINW